jgi:hypothetical protein
MKTVLVKTTVVFAGLTFGVSNVVAHPAFTATCRVLERNPHIGKTFDLNSAEELDFGAPLARAGDTIITCKADLGPGALTILTFANTGDTCDLGPEHAPLATTTDWKEIIKANGETTLICRFGPH